MAPPEPVVAITATGPAPRVAHLRLRSRFRSPCPRPLEAVFADPFCSISVAPRVFPSRALPWPRLIVRFPTASTPRLLLPALSSHVRLARLEAPHRPSRVPQPLHRDRCSEGKSEASCLRRGRSTATQEGQAPPPGAAPHQTIDVARDFGSSAVQCGPAAPTPLLTMMSTTRTMTRCFCSATRRGAASPVPPVGA